MIQSELDRIFKPFATKLKSTELDTYDSDLMREGLVKKTGTIITNVEDYMLMDSGWDREINSEVHSFKHYITRNYVDFIVRTKKIVPCEGMTTVTVDGKKVVLKFPNGNFYNEG